MEQTGAKAVYRVLDLIWELGHFPTGATVSTLAQHLDLPAPTVHRLLRALVDKRFAVQDAATKRYLLGTQIVSLANQAAGGARMAAIARPILDRLAAAARETVFLSILDGAEILYLDCVLSGRSVHMWGAPGMRGPLHATSQGKALLAFLPEPTLQRLLPTIDFRPFTDRTIADVKALRRELTKVREQGYAVNDEEHEEGVRSVSAPVLGQNGYSVAVICVAAPAFRTPLDTIRRHLAPAAVTAATELSQRLTDLQGDGLLPDRSLDSERGTDLQPKTKQPVASS